MGVVLLRLSLKETVRIFEIDIKAVSLVHAAYYIVSVVLIRLYLQQERSQW